MESAISRLNEVLVIPKTDIVRDSAIKRFEIVFDMTWKTVKAFLQERQGVNVASPKEAFREAYRQKLIPYDDFWLDLADKRNLTVHTYKKAVAEEVFVILPKALEHFQELYSKLKQG